MQIKRLREEGSRLLEEQQKLLKEDLQQQETPENPGNYGLVTPKLKVFISSASVISFIRTVICQGMNDRVFSR